MRRQSQPEWLPAMARAVAEALGVPQEKVFLKRRRAGKGEGPRYERIAHTDRRIVIAEGDLKFLVNPADYLDTGLFADHRETRRMVRQCAAGRDFLNLFCYTGAFTCYAAAGGARTTLSVDRSETAIRWARENLALNGIPLGGHTLVQADAAELLKRIVRGPARFDLAVVDPPSFSTTRSRGAAFDIAADHPALIAALVGVMRKGATIFFSTNHQRFVLRLDGLELAAVEEITAATVPEDYRRKRQPIHRCWRFTV
jgi:23S rRNA G2069 N7-methylase RlmK/C1962 C5-methylase RlmI